MWSKGTIGELCEIEYGTRVVRKNELGDEYPVYGGGGETFRINRKNRTDRLIISRFGMSERCARFVAGDFFLNDSGLTVSPKDSDLSQAYLDKVILAKNGEIFSLGRGSAQKNLNMNGFKELFFEYPPLAEQRRIVAKLDAAFAEIDGALEKLSLKLEAQNQILNTGLDKYFAEKIISNQISPMTDVINKITYGFTNPMPSAEQGNYLVTAKNVRDGKIDYQNARFTTNEAYETLLTDKSKPTIGDVLLTKDGTLGRLAVVDRDGICINQSVAVISPSDALNSYFLKWQLSSPVFQRKMISEAGGTTIKHIYITRVDKMDIYVPSLERQRECVEFFDKLDELTKSYINKTNKQLQNYLSLKAAILAQELQSEAA